MSLTKWLVRSAALAALMALLLAPSAGRSAEGRALALAQDKDAWALVDETVEYRTGPLEDVAAMACRAKGGALEFVETRGDAAEGYVHVFKAIKSGHAKIVCETEKTGGGKTESRFGVKVVAESEVPAVKISALEADAAPYLGTLVRITGKNQGWGAPDHAQKIWGCHGTKSDWILEDDTGAVYVTGSMPPEPEYLSVIALAFECEGAWGVSSVRIKVEDKPAEDGKSSGRGVGCKAKETVLVEGETASLKVGKLAVVKVEPDRSHVFEYRLEGEALEVVDQDRDQLRLRAAEPGVATVKIYLRYFNDPAWTDEDFEKTEQTPRVFPVEVKKK